MVRREADRSTLKTERGKVGAASYQGVEKQASGRQPRRAAFWKAQHIRSYVSIYKSRTTPDHGLRRGFSTPG